MCDLPADRRRHHGDPLLGSLHSVCTRHRFSRAEGDISEGPDILSEWCPARSSSIHSDPRTLVPAYRLTHAAALTVHSIAVEQTQRYSSLDAVYALDLVVNGV